ncbi:unnamed protein product [Haemonchus placei]|uniref:Uncharacterized protein n=1 Tax=Haemonchus placei TaxID=6290 RepID=A0A3P8A106_HAEPC|nr:unnamed protein product [Haemonchus placei]
MGRDRGCRRSCEHVYRLTRRPSSQRTSRKMQNLVCRRRPNAGSLLNYLKIRNHYHCQMNYRDRQMTTVFSWLHLQCTL